MPTIEEAADKIRRDRRSGASEIARRAAIILAVAADNARTDHALRRNMVRLGRTLLRAQPTMASLLNLVNDVLLASESPRNPKDRVRRVLETFYSEQDSGPGRMAGHLARLLKRGGRLLTHSYSSSVVQAIGVLRQRPEFRTPLKIVCTESRPLLEGRNTARQLAQMGIHVTLVVDALAGEYLEQGRVDAIVVGADAVLESGLVNKCGTVGLARVAGLRKIPVFALAGRDKFLPPALAHHIQIRPEDGAEIWPRHPSGIRLENRYFDQTPLPLVTSFVTPGGCLSPGQALKTMKSRLAHPLLAGRRH
ncbi:MAG: hypothetical protein A2V83_02560 [Nitrospirae bacterium RBG_16_64_22]|nr:MAG: hypothetical protein A2V83_02560 [Nitrospirae bacterium RBG_16_64_22]